jgi:peptidyl-tRNA hydrolase, PTH1 family
VTRTVVGLGNPGSTYAATRHNVGFMVVEELARRWRLVFQLFRRSARLTQGTIAGKHTMLIEPQLYMNRSGAALVDPVLPLRVTELIVIHDDLDLELGDVRVKRGGGTGGHHGLESIAEYYGTEFTRVRIGIGRPVPGGDVVDYVLSPFAAQERATADAAIRRAADALECVLREGELRAMNRFNVRTMGGAAAGAPMGRN